MQGVDECGYFDQQQENEEEEEQVIGYGCTVDRKYFVLNILCAKISSYLIFVGRVSHEN